MPASPRDAIARHWEADLKVSEELVRALSGVLDIREVFAQISDIVAAVLPHDRLTMTFHDGQGTFVTSRMSKSRMATHRARLVDELKQIVRQATGLGLSTDQLHELLAEAANGVVKSDAVATIEDLKS